MTVTDSRDAQIAEARKEGYSDDEILTHVMNVSDESRKSQIAEAKNEGYNSADIMNHLYPSLAPKPEKEPSTAESAARLAMQGVIGAAEGSNYGLAYDLGATGANLIQKPLPPTATFPFFNEEENKRVQEQRVIETSEHMEIPTISDMFESIGKALGVDTKPKTLPEKGLRLTAQARQIGKHLIGKGAEVLGLTGKELAKQELKNYAAASTLTIPAVIAEEEAGIPSWATLILTGPAFLAGKKVIEAGKQAVRMGANEFLLFDTTKWDIKKPIESFKKEWGNARRNAREQLLFGNIDQQKYDMIKPILDKAAQYNIPVNLGALLDSQYVRSMERIIAKRDLSQEAAQKFMQKSADAWANSYLQAAKRISQTHHFTEKSGVIDSLLDNVTRKRHDELQKKYFELYGSSRKGFKGSENLDADEIGQIEDSITRTIDKLGSPLFPTSAQESARGVAQSGKERLLVSPSQAGRPELENVRFPAKPGAGKQKVAEVGEAVQTAIDMGSPEYRAQVGPQAQRVTEGIQKGAKSSQKRLSNKNQQILEEIFGDEAKNMRIDENGKIKFLKPMNAENAVDTIQALNSYVDWDKPQIRNLMKDPLHTVKTILGRKYGKTNPQAYQDYLEANKTFIESQRLFGENAPFKKWGIKSDTTPAELLRTIGDLSRFKQFEREFSKTGQGRELIDELKRLKYEELLAPIFEHADYVPGRIANGLKKMFRNAEFNYITPKEVRQDLKQLAEIDQKIKSTSSKFYKTPENGDAKQELYDNLLLFFSPKAWAVKVGIKTAGQHAEKAFADVLFDPDNVKKIKNLATQGFNALNTPTTPKATIQNILAEIEALGISIFTYEKMLAGQAAGGRLDREEKELEVPEFAR